MHMHMRALKYVRACMWAGVDMHKPMCMSARAWDCAPVALLWRMECMSSNLKEQLSLSGLKSQIVHLDVICSDLTLDASRRPCVLKWSSEA
mmetsp:Transcript_795/g.1638  ORF Transcript_795/g.1638 Transcript_795/m.1638 type:complete len:91 (-) Transcript_795:107-379(-)